MPTSYCSQPCIGIVVNAGITATSFLWSQKQHERILASDPRVSLFSHIHFFVLFCFGFGFVFFVFCFLATQGHMVFLAELQFQPTKAAAVGTPDSHPTVPVRGSNLHPSALEMPLIPLWHSWDSVCVYFCFLS